ncbi:unnamed protein product [Mytilus coruscus]|uniref:Reverse transcriptase/retrotransposon-derived protein RNase H-like domain-containing protein n=1 Tax=Mytilus coruscus TaxID=42192 RepID=A0A6J8AP07_MYTCO|nr:unnamed protein product [Mytilus coruscus]
MAESDKEKTSIVTTKGLFQFKVMPFGLCNAGACFERLMEKKFLGHVVSEEGVATNPDKIAAIKEWPTPRTVHEVRSFIGTCSYYRRYIRGFSDIARPLHKLTEKGDRFQWTLECQQALDTLKECLISAPILGYPNISKPFILDTDVSGYGIGTV